MPTYTTGNDTASITAASGDVVLLAGNDTLTVTGATITGTIYGEDSTYPDYIATSNYNDSVTLLNSTVTGRIQLSFGSDTLLLDNSTVIGNLDRDLAGTGGAGNTVTLQNNSSIGLIWYEDYYDASGNIPSGSDTVTITDSAVVNRIATESGNDTVSLRNADVGMTGTDNGNRYVALGSGDDTLTSTGTTLAPTRIGTGVDAGAGNDLVTLEYTEMGFGLTAQFDRMRVDLGTGNDTLNLGTGVVFDHRTGYAGQADILGGSGSDVFKLTAIPTDSFIIQGSEDSGNTDIDVLDLSALDPATFTLARTGEAGTVTFTNGKVVTFSQIENVILPYAPPNGVVDGETTSESMLLGYNDAGQITNGGGDVITTGNDSIMGNAGNDTINGDNGDDTIDGGADNDSILGGVGNDSILGGTGNDSIDGGTQNDTIDGGTGNDSLLGNTGNDSILGGAGFDTIYGDNGNDTIDGGADNDSLFGGVGNDSLIGGVGNDRLEAGDGTDTLLGGEGNDSVYGQAGDDDIVFGEGDYAEGGDGDDVFIVNKALTGNDAITIWGGEGDEGGLDTANGGAGDVLDLRGLSGLVVTMTGAESGTATYLNDAGQTVSLSFSQIETILKTQDLIVHGTAGNDVMAIGYVDAQGDIIDGVDGLNDTILAGAGDDSVSAGFGDDTVNAGDGNDTVTAGDGNDTVDGGIGNDSILGGVGYDSIIAGAGDDVVDGGAGNDTVDGGSGNDSILGAAGLDLIAAGDGNDTVDAGSENDTVDGGLALDLLYGGTGDDSLTGGAGDDTTYGGDGSDSIGTGDTGNDLIYGGSGVDYLTGDLGNDTIFGGDDDDRIEGHQGADSIFGGSGDDYIAGADVSNNSTGWNPTVETEDNLSDTLYGDDGNDTLFGNGGNDLLYGGADNDVIIYGTGNDTVYAGTGNDRIDDIDGGASSLSGNNLIYAGSGDDTVFDGGGNDTVYGEDGNDLLTGENGGDDALYGGIGADTLYGEAGNDLLDGGDGADLIEYGVGNNTVYGGAGDDDIDDQTGALTGNNLIYAGDGNDTVSDANGNDTFFGGAGNDWFQGDEGGADYTDGGTGNDYIEAGNGSDTLIGGEGNDLLEAGNDDDDLIVGAGDRAEGRSGDDVFTIDATLAGTGNVTVWGGEFDQGGADTTNGGAGDILDLRGLNGVTVSYGGFGGSVAEWGIATYINSAGQTVTIEFGEIEQVLFSDKIVTGTTGSDSMGIGYVDPSDGDIIDGADGLNDSIRGGAGNDTINAGLGNDTVDGGTGNDSITGGSGAGQDIIYGGTGNDTVVGGGSNDNYYGGADADTFVADLTGVTGAGNWVVDGGSTGVDNDTLDLTALTSTGWVVTGMTKNPETNGNPGFTGNIQMFNAGTGESIVINYTDIENFVGLPNGVVDGEVTSETMGLGYNDAGQATNGGGDIITTGNDSIRGNAGNDTISADAGNDTVDGGADNDSIFGGAGNDSILGGTGNDIVNGDAGNDTIDGGADNDILTGGLGNDILTGGAGDDVFVYTAGDGADTITDFLDQTGSIDDNNQANNNLVDLSAFYNETTVAAVNAADANPANDFGNPLAMLRADAADGVIDGIINGVDYSAQIGAINLTIKDNGVAVQGSDLTYDNTNVPCFVRGTRITTVAGQVAVENLQIGDRVITRDNGFQEIRWIGSRKVAAVGKMAPVKISAGALDFNDQDLWLSPNHRVLQMGSAMDLLFDSREVLSAAKHLVGNGGIFQVFGTEVEYFHVLFDSHQIILSNGIWTESFHPGQEGMNAFEDEVRQEIFALFPELIAENGAVAYGDTARIVLRAYEAKLARAYTGTGRNR